MADYIKRTDVMTICERYSQHCFESSDSRGQDIADRILDDVCEMPVVDVVEVKHREWIIIGKTKGRSNILQCSSCGKVRKGVGKSAYCRDCGAKMDGERK